MDQYKKLLKKHYSSFWGNNYVEKKWDKGPINEIFNKFTILEFQPNETRDMWTYATCGMSTFTHKRPVELHIFSSVSDDSILELLTSLCYYHNVDENINLGHTVNFGRSWQGDSNFSYGLISLPYLDGPDLEIIDPGDGRKAISCYWLIPISLSEREYKIKYGLEALEEKFEETPINYIDVKRNSVV